MRSVYLFEAFTRIENLKLMSCDVMTSRVLLFFFPRQFPCWNANLRMIISSDVFHLDSLLLLLFCFFVCCWGHWIRIYSIDTAWNSEQRKIVEIIWKLVLECWLNQYKTTTIMTIITKSWTKKMGKKHNMHWTAILIKWLARLLSTSVSVSACLIASLFKN